jgi:3-phosphoshikimate 1-carboxyvinyltransferase
MKLKIVPLERLRGTIALPASKSYSIRAYFVAACGGHSRIIGASDCDDALVARRIAAALGARVTAAANACTVKMPSFQKLKPLLRINVGESGTSLRFVLPLLPFFGGKAVVEGKGTLVGRPNHHLCASLRACGLKIRGDGLKESVPVHYDGGSLPGGTLTIDGSVSSQFISALMIAAPLSDADTTLVMTGDTLVSRDYVVMTRQILARAGVRVTPKGRRKFLIPGGQTFSGLKNFNVPSDWGLAAFWMAAAALHRSSIILKGHFDDSLVQSDGAILPFLETMGLKYTRTAKSLTIKGPFALKGGVFSLKDCPDLVPIMAVTAMFAQGPTRLKDIAHARVKESDRISDLRRELLKAGADIQETPDELIITPRTSYRQGITLDPHHDHRLAMAFAVLGTRIGVTVSAVECTSKSYPGFVKTLKGITQK